MSTNALITPWQSLEPRNRQKIYFDLAAVQAATRQPHARHNFLRTDQIIYLIFWGKPPHALCYVWLQLVLSIIDDASNKRRRWRLISVGRRAPPPPPHRLAWEKYETKLTSLFSSFIFSCICSNVIPLLIYECDIHIIKQRGPASTCHPPGTVGLGKSVKKTHSANFCLFFFTFSYFEELLYLW